MAYVMCSSCAVLITIFSTGGKFWPVSNFMELHALTQATRSHALLALSYSHLYNNEASLSSWAFVTVQFLIANAQLHCKWSKTGAGKCFNVHSGALEYCTEKGSISGNTCLIKSGECSTVCNNPHNAIFRFNENLHQFQGSIHQSSKLATLLIFFLSMGVKGRKRDERERGKH